MLRRLTVAGLLLIAGLSLGCSDDGANNPSAAENKRDEFVKGVEDRISELQTGLDELREDITTGKASREIEQQARELEESLGDAESELDEVRGAGDDEWQALRDNLEETLSDARDFAGEIGSELGVN